MQARILRARGGRPRAVADLYTLRETDTVPGVVCSRDAAPSALLTSREP